nr:hypothetical protein [Tanacetum cinerariifolium]
MESLKESIQERAKNKQEYDSGMNERQMQSKEGKVDSSKALNADLVVIESSGTELENHDTSSRSKNDTHAEDADIKFVNDKEPMVEVQLTAQNNVLANEQQHSVQSEPIYDTQLLKKVDRNTTLDSPNMCHMGEEIDQNSKKYEQHGQILNETSNKAMIKKEIETKDHNDSLFALINSKNVENVDLKAQIQEKVFANATLKNKLIKLKGNSVDTKFVKPSILGKPVLQPPRNQSIVRQLNAFKSERTNFSKPRFSSQVDVNNILSKTVTPHYLPKVRESVFVKPHHVIASGSSRCSSKESYGSNDMAHNYYLEEAKIKTQDKNMNFKPSVMHTTRSNNQTSRSLPKYVFNANHDACITKFLKKVNSRVKVQSPKTRNSNKPVEPKIHTEKPGRQIVTGHRFSPNKSFAVNEKINTPRSCLRWIPMGRIFNTVDLRWVPTGKTLASSTTKVDCEPSNGSNKDITNPYECD